MSQLKPHLETIPEELLRVILDYAMIRDSALLIDYDPSDHHIGVRCPHRRDKRETHIADWIFANSVCRRMRLVGRVAFFANKSFAMRSTFPDLLAHGLKPRTGFGRIMAAAPENFLAHMHHVVLIDAHTFSATWMLKLPYLLSTDMFPKLGEVTLFYKSGHESDGEVLTASVAVAKPLCEEFRGPLAEIGVARQIRVTETLGFEIGCEEGRYMWRKWVLPTLKLEAACIQAR